MSQRKTKKPAPKRNPRVAKQTRKRNPKVAELKNPNGRPTKFSEIIANSIYAWAALGKTDLQTAAIMGIDEQTLTNWKKEYPDFFGSLKTAKLEADKNIEKSLYERAKGYSHESVKIHFDQFGNVTEHPFIEKYPPDPTSMIFWLKNRQPGKYREKSEREITGKNGGPIETQTQAVVRINVNLPANGREAKEEEKK